MSSDQISELRQTVPKNGQNEDNSNSTLEILVFLMNESSVAIRLDGRVSGLTVSHVLDEVYRKSQNTEINLNFNKKLRKLFSLWITSPYLEIQLESSQKPFCVLGKWNYLLTRHGPIQVMADPTLIEKDEPTLSFQRNVFCDQKLEEEISETDIGALYLLYYESKLNVLDGRYPIPVDSTHSFEELAAYQAAIELGKHEKTEYSSEYFRQNLKQYIPFNYIKGSEGNKFNGLIRTLSRGSPSIRCAQKIHEIYKEISKEQVSEYKLLRKYLEICWQIPCYGSAYFSAQIEKPIKSKIDSLKNHFDLEVWVAINQTGLHVISKEKPELLVSIDHLDLIWAVGCPKSSDPNCIPCIYVEIPSEDENDNSSDKPSNILQIFSRQFRLIESLLTSFINDTKNSLNSRTNSYRNSNRDSLDVVDGPVPPPQMAPPVLLRQISVNSKVYNRQRLSFATIDTSGKVINKTGSWVRAKKDKN